MSILTIVTTLLKFADGLMKYLNQQQLLEAGKAMQSSANLQRALDEVNRANAARDKLERSLAEHGPGWMPSDDPFRRD